MSLHYSIKSNIVSDIFKYINGGIELGERDRLEEKILVMQIFELISYFLDM